MKGGGGISQKVNGNKGVQLYFFPNGSVPQQKANRRGKHFTLLGFTTLGGDSLMCVVILAKKCGNKMWEMGVDLFAEKEEDGSDTDYTNKNKGPGK